MKRNMGNIFNGVYYTRSLRLGSKGIIYKFRSEDME